VPGIVAGMTGGADSIDDLDLLRHGRARRRRWLAVSGCPVPCLDPAGRAAPGERGGSLPARVASISRPARREALR
jgi:hypothetical protein